MSIGKEKEKVCWLQYGESDEKAGFVFQQKKNINSIQKRQ